MFYGKIHEQTILEISQGDEIRATADSFLIDRQARELSRHPRRFYKGFLNAFIEYCNANSLTFIQEITPDFLRRYFLAFGEKHNPGGVHGAYRTLRAFFQWLTKQEVMAPDWKNPMLKVKAPKVVLDPLQPISIQDVRALITTCQRGDFIGERDRAIFLFLLDTGARAREACNMNIKDTAKAVKHEWFLSDAQPEGLCALICACVTTPLLPCSSRRMKNVLPMMN